MEIAPMYGMAGTLENRSGIGVWCAYSAPDPEGGEDIWKVSHLSPGQATDGIDVDYIRVSDSNRNVLCWAGGFGGVVKNPAWKTGSWVKIRQLVTTEIQKDRDRPTMGFLYMQIVIFGRPNIALSEAKGYDGGRSEASRGTNAVKEAIAYWEALIGGGLTSPMKTQRLPGW